MEAVGMIHIQIKQYIAHHMRYLIAFPNIRSMME
jgi:hypothetical protein